MNFEQIKADLLHKATIDGLVKINFMNKDTMDYDISNGWKIATAQLLRESINANPNMTQMAIPFQIFADILYEVAERAIQLNDPKLNALMCRLALYSQSDPYSPDFDKELTNKVIGDGYPELSPGHADGGFF